MKSVVTVLAHVFEKFAEQSAKMFEINTIFCVTVLGCFWQIGLKTTAAKNLQLF